MSSDTEADSKYLMETNNVANDLDRTLEACEQRIERKKARKQHKSRTKRGEAEAWTAADLDILHNKKLDLIDIARYLNRTVQECHNKLNEETPEEEEETPEEESEDAVDARKRKIKEIEKSMEELKRMKQSLEELNEVQKIFNRYDEYSLKLIRKAYLSGKKEDWKFASEKTGRDVESLKRYARRHREKLKAMSASAPVLIPATSLTSGQMMMMVQMPGEPGAAPAFALYPVPYR